MVRRVALLTVGWVLLLSKLAWADEPDGWSAQKAEVKPPPPPDPFEPYLVSQHLEFGMGFLGGMRDEGRTGFVFSNGGDGVSGSKGLIDPFTTAPYNGMVVTGLDWELRAVVNHLRMGFGVQKPFTAFSLRSVESTDTLDGTTRTINPRALSMWDLRFVIGVEQRFRLLTPFVDLVGDAQSIHTDLTVDDVPTSYGAWTFGFSVRAGVRFHLGHFMFLAVAGEVGIYGPERFGGTVQVGWQVPLPGDD